MKSAQQILGWDCSVARLSDFGSQAGIGNNLQRLWSRARAGRRIGVAHD